MTAPKSLIINSPFELPTHYWRKSGDKKLEIEAGRRPAGYEIFDTRNNTIRGVELELVNRIRTRVDEWRAADYPGITSVTRRLLEHWVDPSARRNQFYFCQIEAIETLIWNVEASPDFKQGIAIPGDGGAWERLCSKMATGSGKTAVMAMIISWQVLNALSYPKRVKDFSRAVFIVAPGLTVKERLQVLRPGHLNNYYDEFSLCPNEAQRQKLNQVELLIENWHSLMPLKEADRSVVKKGAESDEAYVRRVLGKLSGYRDLLVINDEAHHAYPIGSTGKMHTWYSTKHCENTTKSHINYAVADSTWEQYTVQALEKHAEVLTYAKNDHLGFQIYYLWNGSRRRFIPDFIIRLVNGKNLILEIKGQDSDQNKAKRSALDAWVKAVNSRGGFGIWCWDVAFEPAKVHDIIANWALPVRKS